MIAVDEEALICDFAETYHIYDFRSLPARKAATLAVGLRDDSRIKLKMSGMNVSNELLMTAVIADRMGQLLWGLSGGDGPPPASLAGQLQGVDNTLNDNKDIIVFDTGAAYEAARKTMMKEG